MAQINKPNQYFNTVLYTGTGSSNSITGVGFQPDLTWIKSRSVVGSGHRWHDSVRGAGNMIASDSTGAEFDDSALFTSFDTDGFTVAGTGSGYNGSSQTYASWNWLASNTTASNTDGSITSTVSANTTSGFSIVTWTTTGTGSDTVGHGLGATPKIVLMKRRDSTSNWTFYTTIVDGTLDYLSLNLTDAKGDSGWSLPTSSVFSQSTIGGNAVAYCFAEKKGFSKFGSYIGNGSTDGTFVYTGFKPAFVMVKRTDSTAQWQILDNKRNTYNPWNTALFPDTTDIDTTDYSTDHLSNGFKLRVTTASRNGSGATYIYMAFAENPLVGTNNTPATAR